MRTGTPAHDDLDLARDVVRLAEAAEASLEQGGERMTVAPGGHAQDGLSSAPAADVREPM